MDVENDYNDDNDNDNDNGLFFFCQSNCVQNPCKNNATCQSGFTKKGYGCLCTAGFEGLICERGKHNSNVDSLRLSSLTKRKIFTALLVN